MAAGTGARSMLAAAAVVVAILGSGHLLGRLSEGPAKDSAADAPTRPPSVPPGPTPEQDSGGALGAPLPPEPGGPFGSRRTTGSSSVALTFDDGPDPYWTPRVLAVLREHRVTATFCLVGFLVERYPQVVRQISAEGHTLCNHTWRHDFNLGSRSARAVRADLTRTHGAIQRAVPGVRVPYYRQPGGRWSATVVSVARRMGMTSLHWMVDPQDWRRPAPRTLARAVLADTAAGSIVLLHDGGGDRHNSVAALRIVLPDLAARFVLAALPTEPARPRTPSAPNGP